MFPTFYERKQKLIGALLIAIGLLFFIPSCVLVFFLDVDPGVIYFFTPLALIFGVLGFLFLIRQSKVLTIKENSLMITCGDKIEELLFHNIVSYQFGLFRLEPTGLDSLSVAMVAGVQKMSGGQLGDSVWLTSSMLYLIKKDGRRLCIGAQYQNHAEAVRLILEKVRPLIDQKRQEEWSKHQKICFGKLTLTPDFLFFKNKKIPLSPKQGRLFFLNNGFLQVSSLKRVEGSIRLFDIPDSFSFFHFLKQFRGVDLDPAPSLLKKKDGWVLVACGIAFYALGFAVYFYGHPARDVSGFYFFVPFASFFIVYGYLKIRKG